ncbi:MAG: alpha/beta hydrolase [Solirubrobacterales bacterium]|nr:MAG: alpha/beta hydrolase [Solirubrobacterales bacterium]
METVVDAVANAWDTLIGGGVADLRPTPSSIVAQGPQRTVRRYRSPQHARPDAAPVLLVPPLAAPISCFDLRRRCSLAEYLLAHGFPCYVVDYGPIGFSDRQLGLEHWIEEVIPTAVADVSDDAGGVPVRIVGWCLGGIISLFSVAAHPELPVQAIAAVASPFDFQQVRLFAPIRRLAGLTGGGVVTGLYRALGGAPAPLVGWAFKLSAIDKQLTRPLALARNLGDRDALAQMEAVDDYMGRMLAYPGRTFGQLYHRFFLVNEVAEGRLGLGRRRPEISLEGIRQPVLSVAGTADVLAPRAAVHPLGDLLPNAAEVEIRDAPGGHLGVLAGRSAAHTTWRYVRDFLDRQVS